MVDDDRNLTVTPVGFLSECYDASLVDFLQECDTGGSSRGDNSSGDIGILGLINFGFLVPSVGRTMIDTAFLTTVLGSR